MVDGYYTMGQYDFVITVELPNDETAMSYVSYWNSRKCSYCNTKGIFNI